jgi:hypothetical protein
MPRHTGQDSRDAVRRALTQPGAARARGTAQPGFSRARMSARSVKFSFRGEILPQMVGAADTGISLSGPV